MEADYVNTPEAFAAADTKAELESLKSLTVEKAAAQLEALLNSWAEIERSLEETRMPPRLPNPRPGPSLAILLAGTPSTDDQE